MGRSVATEVTDPTRVEELAWNAAVGAVCYNLGLVGCPRGRDWGRERKRALRGKQKLGVIMFNHEAPSESRRPATLRELRMGEIGRGTKMPSW